MRSKDHEFLWPDNEPGAYPGNPYTFAVEGDMTMSKHAYAALPQEVLAEAVDRMLTGGNSISSALIGLFGPDDFVEWACWGDSDPDKPYAVARREIKKRFRFRRHMAYHIAYEMWVMWYACMVSARKITSALDDLQEPSASWSDE